MPSGRERAPAGCAAAAGGRDRRASRSGDRFAIADATLDLQLQYRPPAEIDRDRFELWARRARLDARAGRRAALRGDVATLTWICDRIAAHLGPVERVRLDRHLGRLESDAASGHLRAAARSARTAAEYPAAACVVVSRCAR